MLWHWVLSLWRGRCSEMVITRFNDIRPVAPVNAPAEESAARGRGRGRSSTASWNRSATRRLFLSIADLIFSFRAWHTGTLGEIMAIRQLAQWVRRSSGLLFFVLSTALFLFAH
uniref:Uncharacterized protein n=1 Tax=Solanum tuberosum TaxID=4113 RepID=M1DHQ4_SOLTU